jgi:hypothetical protein
MATTGSHWGYCNDEQRHSICCKLADAVLSKMSTSQILAYCPQYYGPDVTDNHRSYIWDQCYDEYDALDDYTLMRRYEAVMHPDGQIEASFRSGKYQGDPNKLN